MFLIDTYLFTMAQHPRGPRPLHYQEFVITLRHITVGRTAVDE